MTMGEFISCTHQDFGPLDDSHPDAPVWNTQTNISLLVAAKMGPEGADLANAAISDMMSRCDLMLPAISVWMSYAERIVTLLHECSSDTCKGMNQFDMDALRMEAIMQDNHDHLKAFDAYEEVSPHLRGGDHRRGLKIGHKWWHAMNEDQRLAFVNLFLIIAASTISSVISGTDPDIAKQLLAADRALTDISTIDDIPGL